MVGSRAHPTRGAGTRISAKADYAVRAALVLAVGADPGRPLKGEEIARAASIPSRFLEIVLAELRRAGLVGAKRGAEGGYWLTRAPEDVSVADLVRTIDGPLVLVAGRGPDASRYPVDVAALPDVWARAGRAVREVLEEATLDRLVPAAQVPDWQI